MEPGEHSRVNHRQHGRKTVAHISQKEDGGIFTAFQATARTDSNLGMEIHMWNRP